MAETNQDPVFIEEKTHLEMCGKIIQNNISDYSKRLSELGSEVKEMYDRYRSDNPELHNDLVIGMDLQLQWQRTLYKNEMALDKPYFGRIDYFDDRERTIYIGKNGILKSSSEVLIVDWRAPVSTVYYDSSVGKASFESPSGEEIPIELKLKRTFEIEGGELVDYYDTDVVANDEFLTKFLGKTKEAVLGEIIATIQKEQNEIIRDTPWHNIIVQGVAGSGKTTVAMHRISYILFNYKEKFKAQEFYIIGSNKMLLNYITGVLPSLDVYGVSQMTMNELFLSCLGKDVSIKKRTKLTEQENANQEQIEKLKGSVIFPLLLDEYMNQWEKNRFAKEDVKYQGKVIYQCSDILEFLQTFPNMPMQEKTEALNKRMINKIQFRAEAEGKEPSDVRKEMKKYRKFFGQSKERFNFKEVYINFLNDLQNDSLQDEFKAVITSYAVSINEDEKENMFPGADLVGQVLAGFLNGSMDVYDLAMLCLIKKRLKLTDDFDFVSHVVVDEAQDFGASVFYILKRIFKEATFTVMGDISQNINYYSGMNDWETLKDVVFNQERDRFYTLSKSYRNTVEISDYATNVLEKCSFQTYKIDPVIRHGREVEVMDAVSDQEMADHTAERIRRMQKDRFETIAVICRTEEECEDVRSMLKDREIICNDCDYEQMTFEAGVMVLPIQMSKGLEFDAVVLWNPSEENYPYSDSEAKLLYVAITRALHELFIVCKGRPSLLLDRRQKT